MPKKNTTPPKAGSSKQDKKPFLITAPEADEPLLPLNNDPDIIPDDDEMATPPYEAPEPGEGP